MGGAAFNLFKDSRFGPKSAKQAEIRPAGLRRILRIRPDLEAAWEVPRPTRSSLWLYLLQIPQDMANMP
jgi:hypothetical protein